MKSHELAERVARLQHDLVILSMSNISEERLHEMIDNISVKVAVYAAEAEKFYPEEKKPERQEPKFFINTRGIWSEE